MPDTSAPRIEYGVTPTHVMASMPGIDFVRAMFAGKLPSPPIMQTIEPFDYAAEPGIISFQSVPGFRHYNPIGSVHGSYAAALLDSANVGRRAATAEARITDSKGRLLAHATTTCLVFEIPKEG
jgi:acyl-coenzyme A thioesterase PaaI-like protein